MLIFNSVKLIILSQLANLISICIFIRVCQQINGKLQSEPNALALTKAFGSVFGLLTSWEEMVAEFVRSDDITSKVIYSKSIT